MSGPFKRLWILARAQLIFTLMDLWNLMRPRRRWRRDDEQTLSILSLTSQGACVPEAAISSWTNRQCKQAEDWAWSVHLHASDNDDVIIPPTPAHVAEHDTELNRARIEKENEEFWSSLPKRTDH